MTNSIQLYFTIHTILFFLLWYNNYICDNFIQIIIYSNHSKSILNTWSWKVRETLYVNHQNRQIGEMWRTRHTAVRQIGGFWFSREYSSSSNSSRRWEKVAWQNSQNLTRDKGATNQVTCKIIHLKAFFFVIRGRGWRAIMPGQGRFLEAGPQFGLKMEK